MPEAAPTAPEALVGRRVLRVLEEGRFEGTITSARAGLGYGMLWRVTYDDGDDEDLVWHELRTLLLPDTRAAAGGDAATAHAASACASRQLRSTTTAVAAHAAPAARQYKGVYPAQYTTDRWQCALYVPSKRDAAKGKRGLVHLGRFDDVLEAARAYDDAARRHGILAVNFPRPGTREVQAVAGRRMPARLFEQRPKLAAPQRTAQQYLGVAVRSSRFEARLREFHGGMHDTAEAAARTVDEELRRRNQLHKLNFPATAAERAAKARGQPAAPQAAPAPRQRKRTLEPESAAAPTRAAKTPRAQPAMAGAAAAARSGPGLATAVAPAASDDDMDAAAMEEPEEEEVAAKGSGAATLLPIAPAAAKEPAAALPTAAPTAAPMLAPPAAALPAPAPPAAAADSKLAAVAAFLRGIQPPLEQLDAALAALPGSGVTMARLASFAASGQRAMLVDRAAESLCLQLPFDRLAVLQALLALSQGAAQA